MNYRNFYVDDQNNNREVPDPIDVPMIPLPNPGEGGPVNTGGENQPVTPLPNPGEGGPVNTGGENQPVIPLPNPGEGGPVYSGGSQNNMNRPPVTILPGNTSIPNIIQTIISSHPRPNGNCKFCGTETTQTGTIRFLNTASDYNPFMIYLNSGLFSDTLGFAEVTDYERVPAGYQTVSVVGENGYIYIQKPVQIMKDETVTMAIINTSSGIDLMAIKDVKCDNNYQVSCVRAANLSYNSGPLNLIIGQRNVTFTNVTYMQVTEYKNIWPGNYNYYVTKTAQQSGMNFGNNMASNILLSSVMNVKTNASYTVYMFNWNRNSADAIRVLIVEEI